MMSSLYHFSICLRLSNEVVSLIVAFLKQRLVHQYSIRKERKKEPKNKPQRNR